MIHLNRYGIIKSGQYHGFFLIIEGSFLEPGFTIIVTNQQLNDGYDCFVENIHDVEQHILNKKWEIEWLNDEDDSSLKKRFNEIIEKNTNTQ